MTPQEKQTILDAAVIVARHGYQLGFWDSWRGFGKFVSISEKELDDMVREQELLAAVKAKKLYGDILSAVPKFIPSETHNETALRYIKAGDEEAKR